MKPKVYPPLTMTIAQTLLPEFDHEMATTRKLLGILPPAKAGWRPHPKSWTLGDLSLHLVNLLEWLSTTLATTELDPNPPGGPSWKPRQYESVAATLKAFDANLQKARAALAAVSDADLKVFWTLKNGGQLTVYLRLCDVPLPPVYGPTADVTGDVLAAKAHRG